MVSDHGLNKKQNSRRIINEKLAYSLSELSILSSIGKTTLYKFISENKLKITKVGSRTIVTIDDWKKFIEYLGI